MIAVNVAQMRQFEARLLRLNEKGVKFAEVESVNRAAFETMGAARQELGGKMTLRNTWTQKSIRVQRATLTTPEAVVGSTAGYMETQELGGREEGHGGAAVSIPTSVSSGEGRGAVPRQKTVRKPNKMTSIILNRRRRISRSGSAGNRSRRNVYTVKRAAATGSKFIFLQLQRRRGIFRVYGGKTRPRLEMVQDLTRKSVVIPRNPWLLPVAKDEAKQVARYYSEALARQLRRLR